MPNHPASTFRLVGINFKGPDNADLRRRIRAILTSKATRKDKVNRIVMLRHKIALTSSGVTKLIEIAGDLEMSDEDAS